ncbi:MAG: sulfite exporter TauE/SafE family protein [Phototrophicaceae bacterium]
MSELIIFGLVIGVAVLLVGIGKSGFADGAGLIATPLMALVMPMADATALLLPILLFIDVFNLRHYRNDYDRKNLTLLVPAGIVGIAIGALFFNTFQGNERVLKVGLGVLALVFLAYQLGRTRLLGLAEQYTAPPAFGFAMGILGGFTSTLAHAGLPPILIYLLPQKLEPRRYVGTVAYLFFVINLVKLIPYTALGLLRVGNIPLTLVLLPVTYLGIRLGYWLQARIPKELFARIIYVLLFLTGVRLLFS